VQSALRSTKYSIQITVHGSSLRVYDAHKSNPQSEELTVIPRTVSRHIILAFCLGFIALVFAIPARTENAPVPQGANRIYSKAFCASEQEKPVVYFSKIFDVNITVPTIDTQPLVNGFIIHLKEKYDYHAGSNYPVVCPLYKTLSEAEATKRKMEAQVQPTAKQIIEVDWTPPAWAQPLQAVGGPGYFPQAPPIPTHTFCAVGHESTMYFSAVFDTFGALNNPAWGDAFNDFLRRTYSAKGLVQCTMLDTVREAERNLKARVGGVRANSHKAVETGWKYDPTVKIAKFVPRPTPKDDDDLEPAPRPAPKTPAADARDFATKEAQAALTLCQNDRVMSGAFDCYRIHRTVYNYRIAHAGEVSPEPLVKLLDKLDCSECIIDFRVKGWAQSAAQSRGLQLNAANCVAERFLTNVKAEPYPGHAKKLFDAAIAACKK